MLHLVFKFEKKFFPLWEFSRCRKKILTAGNYPLQEKNSSSGRMPEGQKSCGGQREFTRRPKQRRPASGSLPEGQNSVARPAGVYPKAKTVSPGQREFTRRSKQRRPASGSFPEGHTLNRAEQTAFFRKRTLFAAA